MNTLFKRSHIFHGMNLFGDFLFTKCQDCNKTTMAIDELIWKNYYLCEDCYISHSEERTQTRKSVEQYKPMKCTICSTVKSHPEHRFAYHAHDLFETTCIDKMFNTGVDTEEICKSVDKFDPLCIECYDIVLYLEEKRDINELKQRAQFLYKEHTDEAYSVLREEFKYRINMD